MSSHHTLVIEQLENRRKNGQLIGLATDSSLLDTVFFYLFNKKPPYPLSRTPPDEKIWEDFGKFLLEAS